MSKRLLSLIFLTAFGGLIVTLALAYADPARLDVIAKNLEADFDTIGHMTGEELEARLAAGDQIILLDTRKASEYAVSHIQGAIRISPRASAEEMLAALPMDAEPSDIVFYCSVGARSSRLAKHTQDALIELGITRIDNLRGGIFAWHNEARPLVNEDGTTDLVHPYSRYWGRLLARRELASKRKADP